MATEIQANVKVESMAQFIRVGPGADLYAERGVAPCYLQRGGQGHSSTRGSILNRRLYRLAWLVHVEPETASIEERRNELESDRSHIFGRRALGRLGAVGLCV